MNKICKIDGCGRIVLPKEIVNDSYSIKYDLNSALVVLESTNSCWHHH
ncbi:MAG: hypothetical protein WC932_03135 [archaeon]